MTGGNLLVQTLVQLLLTATPMVGATLIAIRLGIRSVPVLLAIALAASGGAALLVFWVDYLDAWLGAPCAYAVVGVGVVGSVWAWPAARGDLALLRRLAVPFGLWMLGSLFLVFFGYLHGGTEIAMQTSATRFSSRPTQLASDNFLPLFFAEWMLAGHHGTPPIYEPQWMFSDRPPLQIGYLLSQKPFGWDQTTLHAELIGVAIQQLWIVAAWAMLEAARVGRALKGLVIVALLVSDVVIVNGFFIWPKLLSAAFVLAAFALVADPDFDGRHSKVWGPALFGFLCGLSYMAHGSSVFGLIALLAFLLWRRALPRPRCLAAGLVAVLLVVLPWTAYQHWGDPPGNRVVKWTLAGTTRIDQRGVLDEVGHAYSEAGLGTVLENKLQNFLTMAGGGLGTSERTDEWIHFASAFGDTGHAVEDVVHGRFGDAISEIREARFSHLLWALGLILLGLPVIGVAWLRGARPRGPDWALARLCAFVFVVGAVIWGLVVFGNLPSRATIIEGSLALPLVGMIGLVAGLWAIARRWAWWLVGLNVLTVLAIYTPALEWWPGTSYSVFNALLAVACLLGFAALAFGWVPDRVTRWWRRDPPHLPAG